MRPAYVIQRFMALTKVTILIFVCLAIVSTLFAKFQNLVYVNNDIASNSSFIESPFPNHQFRHLMIFLQVTDLHLSIFQDLDRGPDLEKFCKEVVPVIQPSVVLATGDLVDSKTPDHLGSLQYEEEWKIYQEILHRTGVTSKTVWLDIRGNHDNFNTITLDAEDNLFRKYSVQGKKYRRSYSYTLQQGSDIYTFIGIDACLNPGPKRPFNFLGVINQGAYNMLLNIAEENKKSNLTIWFGHYPTSSIASPYPGVRELMRDSGPYLCGHFHTFGGMVPAMYTLQPTGSLELELADWKDNRRFRLAAVDHGLFTFIDHKFGDWPLILITNPKHSLYGMPTIEPLQRMKKSTHIRVLIFSPDAIKSVKVQIDNGPWQNMSHVSKALYVAHWDPELYLDNLHMIKVFTEDKKGREKLLEQSFSLDGSRPMFPFGARLVLMGHISLGQIIFGFLMIITVIPLCILRCLHHYGKTRFIRGKAEFNCCRRFLFKLYLLSSVDYLLWPILLLVTYVAIGPWFIGEIIDGYTGICFVWGIVIAGNILPGGLTYVVGSLFMLTFYIPIVLILAHFTYRRYQIFVTGEETRSQLIVTWVYKIVMIIFIMWQILCAIVCYFSYGLMAFLLGFTTTWSVVFVIIMWRITMTISKSKLPLPVTSLHQEEQHIGGESLLLAEDHQQPQYVINNKPIAHNQVDAS